MSIIIKEITSEQDLKTFIYLPERLHQKHYNWVPPLYIDEKKFFNPKKNPAFSHNTTALFLAYKNNEVVGRVMGIVPLDFNQLKNVKSARFSYLETNEDEAVFQALIQKVEDWARQQGCTEIIGPMGFSDKEPQGFLLKGFDEPQMPVTNHSFPFMVDFITRQGYKPYIELCQYEVPLSQEMVNRYDIFAQRVLQQHQISIKEFRHIREVKPYVKSVFELINSTYTDIYGFTKVSEQEAEEFAQRFLPLLNPRLIKIVTNQEGKAIAFVIAMPNVNEGIQKAKGHLFPFGWFHILRAMKTSKRLVLLLGAVQNEMQNKGLDAMLALKLLGSAISLGFKVMDSHLIMKENTKMRGIIERIDGNRMYKEYGIFRKEI